MPVAEQKQRPRGRGVTQGAFDEGREPVDRLPEVDRFAVQVDRRRVHKHAHGHQPLSTRSSSATQCADTEVGIRSVVSPTCSARSKFCGPLRATVTGTKGDVAVGSASTPASSRRRSQMYWWLMPRSAQNAASSSPLVLNSWNS
ncbi:MAG: hypothetical protein ACYDBH_04520 [Acidobacteriaceae bacterium]